MRQDTLHFTAVKISVKPKQEQIISCKWHRCKEIFTNEQDLVLHLRAKHFNVLFKNECKWNGCKIFGKTFSKPTHVVGHVLQHHCGPKPYM